MRWLGVDPGKAGALALLDDHGRFVEAIATPLVRAVAGKGRDEYDLPEISAELRRLLVNADGALHVTVEKLWPLPPRFNREGGQQQAGGSIANYNRGVSRGWEWMLVALGIPYDMVAPQAWQRVMHAGLAGDDTKQRSLLAVKRLWPTVSLKRTERSRKDDDGIADAMLLAEWGRRRRLGTGGGDAATVEGASSAIQAGPGSPR